VSYFVTRHCFLFLPVLLSLLLSAPPLSGQTVRGVLLNETTGLPVTAGFVVLVDEDSVERQRPYGMRRKRR